MGICTFMSLLIFKIEMNMNEKPLKGVLRRENMNPNYYVHFCFIGCHGNSLLHLVWTKKCQL